MKVKPDAATSNKALYLKEHYNICRKRTEEICKPLEIEDYVVQPIEDVSPPKWHLGHTSWFYEEFILKKYLKDYKVFDPAFNFIFNSYYESMGNRVIRADRGNLSRPTVDNVYAYRKHVDSNMNILLESRETIEFKEVLILGLNHEEQHQELLISDIKYILGHNPLFPSYKATSLDRLNLLPSKEMISIAEGKYEIGYAGNAFCFDNELQPHSVFLPSFRISSNVVSNGEYLEFVEDGAYSNFRYWHAEAWEWVKQEQLKAPMYWHFLEGEWHQYSFQGLKKLNTFAAVCHLSYFEAAAYAVWKGKRLPTEFEWEAAADQLNWGEVWEWTESAYLPYRGFKKAHGALGEYNAKFMVNQMVLRGASLATAKNHSRKSYRNFYNPHLQKQFSGLRLVED